MLVVLAVAAAGSGIGAAADRPELALPVDCEPGKTCFIQNYVDLDPGAGVRDFSCGAASYNGHRGVDFRLLSAAATAVGVPVRAAVAGTVKAVRDGVADEFRSASKADDIKGRECGNGVLLDHGNGWETQYCHLKQGSVRVSKDQAVERGANLGDVGFSGDADFAHVHFTVRHKDRVIDPFQPDALDGPCERSKRAAGLWAADVAAKLPYKAGEIIGWGFTETAPEYRALERNHEAITPPHAQSPALLFYGRFINLSAGDRVRVVILGPGGSFAEELSMPLDRNKSIVVSYAGKKRKGEPWRPGRYEGRVELLRDGAVVATKIAVTTIAPAEASR